MPPANSKFDRDLRRLLRENPNKWTEASIVFALVTRPAPETLEAFLDAADSVVRTLAGAEAGIPPAPQSGHRLRRR